jgi:hypothetical protein
LSARLGEVGKAMSATPKINHYIPSDLEDIAVAFCKANEIQTGKTIAGNMADFEKNGKRNEISAVTKAKLAKIEFFCGNPEKSNADFAQAFYDVYHTPCHSDFCDIDGRIIAVKLAMLETGWLEPIWPRDEIDDGLMNLKIALSRAEQGDAKAALARIEDLAVNKPRRMDSHGEYPIAACCTAWCAERSGRKPKVSR